MFSPSALPLSFLSRLFLLLVEYFFCAFCAVKTQIRAGGGDLRKGVRQRAGHPSPPLHRRAGSMGRHRGQMAQTIKPRTSAFCACSLKVREREECGGGGTHAMHDRLVPLRVALGSFMVRTGRGRVRVTLVL